MVSFGFKTDWAQYRLDFNLLRQVASTCEALGFDALWFSDVFIYPPSRADVPTFECWTMMSSLASITSKIRLGSMVLCNSYRYPALVAKMATTLDHISGGRLDLGLGAGGLQEDNIAYDLPYFKPSMSIERLREAVHLIRLLWTEEKANYQGKYYTLRDAICSPKPIQKPHPPIWIGGRGETLTLRLVAELADGCNFSRTSPEEYAHLLGVLTTHCRSVGRDPNNIKKSLQIYVHIAEDAQRAREKARRFKESTWRESTRTMPLDEYLKSSITGMPQNCVQRIQEYINLGVTHFLLIFPEVHQGDLGGLQLFGEQVIPTFRKG